MIKQLFATMHEALDEIIQQYPYAKEQKKEDLMQRLALLKAMSASFIEEWLLFEEKLERCGEMLLFQSPVIPSLPPICAKLNHPLCQSNDFRKGEGYFILQMFDHAARIFERITDEHPDFILARLYLAYSYANKKHWSEAYRQFEDIAVTSEDPNLKSFSIKAMEAIQHQMEGAHSNLPTDVL